MTCVECGAAGQPDGAKFCAQCGASLSRPSCPACGTPTTPGARFCSECGTPQREPLPSTAGAPVASRRITSVLFGDLVGFTALSEARDQEDVRELLSRYFDECRRVIARYGGTVEKFIGDAVMAVWGVPTAHEDDAERAVRAGLELVWAAEAMGADLGIPELAMRVGIVTGEVAVTIGAEQQGMVAGDAVNTASRVQSVATPGQVWVDETTKLLSSSAITYLDAGSHHLKGKLDPVPLWSVRAVVAGIGGAQREDGLEAPLVGRDRELRLVKEIFHGAEESGRPVLLVVDGEAGVGKSRLGWEFEKYVDGLQRSVRWHSGRCLAYGEGVAYYALAEAIRARLQGLRPEGEEDDASPATLLSLGMDRYVPDAAEREWLAPRLGALLGIGAVGSFEREDLFAAWAGFMRRVGEGHPVVLVIDDAQHADDSLLQFLEYLLGTGGFACLVVLLTRPGLVESHPALATNRAATLLHLHPLAARDMAALLDGLVVGLPESVRRSLVARSEGIPLFGVETVRSLIDRDLVVPRGGQYVLADPERLDLDALGAPASLQALIAARLDALEPEQRRLLDVASIVGDAFTRDQIDHLCPEVADVDRVLAALVHLQLLRQESSRFSADRGLYQFVQAAVRQVAYGMIARRNRKAGHLAVAALLEADPETSGEVSSVIAQHYLAAVDAVPEAPDRDELTARLLDHLERAAARSGGLGAPAEAVGHLRTALDRCPDVLRRARIEGELADQLARAGRYDEAVAHADRAREAFDEHGDVLGAAQAVAVLCDALRRGPGDLEQAMRLAEERLDTLGTHPEGRHTELRLIRTVIGCRLRLHHDYRDLADRELRLAQLTGSLVEVADSYISLGLHYVMNGPPEMARLLLGSAADLARREHDHRIRALALLNLMGSWLQDDIQQALEHGREGMEAARACGDSTWISAAGLGVLAGLAVTGEWDEALDLMAEGSIDNVDFAGAEMIRCWILRARGEAWRPHPDHLTRGGADDPTVLTNRAVIDVYARHERGDAGVVDDAVRAVEQYLGAVGTTEDFTHVWLVVAELVLETCDRSALAALVDLAGREQDNRPPTGLIAARDRVLARIAMLDDVDPDVVESHLRGALSAAESWRAPVLVALCQADLGSFLVNRGRHEEAAAPLSAARKAFEEWQAVRWARQLEAALSGVPS